MNFNQARALVKNDGATFAVRYADGHVYQVWRHRPGTSYADWGRAIVWKSYVQGRGWFVEPWQASDPPPPTVRRI